MNYPLALLVAPAIALASCSSLDPEYAEYKKQQKAEQEAGSPYGPTADPYGANAANPYAVPGQGPTDVGTYTPQGTAPYQPLPNVSADPYDPSGARSGFPTIPGPTGGSAPIVTTHVVAQGDSLWALSRKYNTSVDSIKQANGLTGDTIVLGSTLQIPGN